MSPTPRPHRSHKAMAIAMVIVLTTALLLICAGLLSLVTQEHRLTHRSAAVAELKQTTDTLLGYAAAQLIANPSLPAVELPPADLFSPASDKLTRTSTAEQELLVSAGASLKTAAGADQFYLDPASPFNQHDKLSGKYVYRNLHLIASRAAVRTPGGDRINEYALMVLERRHMHVFNYLAFFDVARFRISNPGSDIVLDGPIQANQGILFSASNQTSVVSIESTLSTPGRFDFANLRSDGTLDYSCSTSAGKFMITDGTFKADGTLKLIDMLKPTTNQLRQSGDAAVFDKNGNLVSNSFKDFCDETTKGHLGTKDTGESVVNLEGLNYQDDSARAIPDAYKLVNNRRIDPPNPALRNSTDPAYADSRAAESAKTAYQAGLYTYVEQNGELTVFTTQKAAETYKNSTNKPAWKADAANQSKFLAADEASAFVGMPYVERYNNGTGDYLAASKNTDLARRAIFDAQQKKTVATVDVDLGALKARINSGALRLANGGSMATTGTTGWNGVLYVDVQNPTARPVAPVKDQDSGHYINPTTKQPDATTTAATALKTPLPSLNLTGTAKAWDTGNAVDDSAGLTAVRIKNAKEVPGAKVGEPGFTLATNTATYTVGSVNADGDTRTGSTSLQDDQSTAGSTTTKIPAAIFSDKNVVLSEEFQDLSYDLQLYVPAPTKRPPGMENSWPFNGPAPDVDDPNRRLKGKTDGQYQYQERPGVPKDPKNPKGPKDPAVMELNCGFIIGDDDNSNKGIHTMLSYLQSFDTDNDTLRMRGALIGIYKSRYFTAKAGSFRDYYVAPKRTFGYSSLFKAGKMPPGAPRIIHHRRVRQFTLSKADYEKLQPLAGQSVDSWLAALGDKY